MKLILIVVLKTNKQIAQFYIILQHVNSSVKNDMGKDN